MIYERIIYPALLYILSLKRERERETLIVRRGAMKLFANGKHMVIRRFDSSRPGFVNGTDVLRNLCDARRVSATGGEQASAHLDALSLNSMRARVAYLYLSVWRAHTHTHTPGVPIVVIPPTSPRRAKAGRFQALLVIFCESHG